MDNWSLEYDKFRLDNILLYYKTGDEYILTTMCVFTGVEQYKNVYDKDDELISPGCTKNNYFIHPITEKRHTALYSSGSDIIDGYGTLYPTLKFNYDTIVEDNGTSYQVYTKPITQPDKWWVNINKKSPINVYGEFPSGKVKISNKTNQLSAISLSYLSTYKEVLELYQDPANIKNKIKRNHELFKETFI